MPPPWATYIFDVDGTLRWTTIPGQHCPHRTGQWRLMPNVRRVLRGIDWRAGVGFGVASNQNDVAAGLLTRATALGLIESTVLAAIGYRPPRSAIELCVCDLRAPCECRKPEPGMLLRILDRLETPAGTALYVGDLESDREAARRAGIEFREAADFFGWPDRGRLP